MIPQDYIQEVVRRNDIEDVVQSYVQLRRRGRTCTGLCPFHTEKTPSFVVYPETQSFYCFGCGAGGDVITFIKKISNLEYVEAVKLLASRVGMPMPNEEDKAGEMRRKVLAINRDAARYFYDQLNKPTPEAALAREYWRKRRGLSDNTIRRFGLGYAPDSYSDLLHYLKGRGYNEEELLESGLVRRSEKGNLYNLFRHRMITPIIDLRGNVIAFGGRVLDDSKPKYINSPETVVYKKSRTLFALNIAKRSTSRRYILCEGYMDVISMHQAGFDTAVCACGTALTAEQVKLLSEYADEVILSYDSDEAGQKATARALGIFGTTGMEIKVLRLTGGKDPDEIIKKYGAQRFRDIINGAANDTEYRLLRARQGIDLSTDDGKVKYLSAATEVLAGIPSPVEVDVYASRLANELGVDKLAIESQVKYKREGLRKRRMAQREQDQKRLLINGQNTKNPERSQHLRAAKAEETLIASLMRNPDFYNKLKDELSADYFVTALNRRIFSVILSRLDEGGNTEPYFLSSEFTPDEMDEVERIFRSAAQLSNTVEECADCIKILKEEKNKPESIKASELSDDDFAKLFRPDKQD